jgi:hypothetical protein
MCAQHISTLFVVFTTLSVGIKQKPIICFLLNVQMREVLYVVQGLALFILIYKGGFPMVVILFLLMPVSVLPARQAARPYRARL